MKSARPVLRTSLALGAVLLLALAGCAERQAPARPAFYRELASYGARLDTTSAQSLLNDYRRSIGLAPLVLDAGLQAEAQRRADESARGGTIADGSRGSGRTQGGRLEILSAGYYTMSDAFSGWRGSPSHDAKLRSPAARRFGIATAYAPDSKYKVYWAVILEP